MPTQTLTNKVAFLGPRKSRSWAPEADPSRECLDSVSIHSDLFQEFWGTSFRCIQGAQSRGSIWLAALSSSGRGPLLPSRLKPLYMTGATHCRCTLQHAVHTLFPRKTAQNEMLTITVAKSFYLGGDSLPEPGAGHVNPGSVSNQTSQIHPLEVLHIIISIQQPRMALSCSKYPEFGTSWSSRGGPTLRSDVDLAGSTWPTRHRAL